MSRPMAISKRRICCPLLGVALTATTTNCASQGSEICAAAAAHVSECLGIAPGIAPEECDSDAAWEVLSAPCTELVADGKADRPWWCFPFLRWLPRCRPQGIVIEIEKPKPEDLAPIQEPEPETEPPPFFFQTDRPQMCRTSSECEPFSAGTGGGYIADVYARHTVCSLDGSCDVPPQGTCGIGQYTFADEDECNGLLQCAAAEIGETPCEADVDRRVSMYRTGAVVPHLQCAAGDLSDTSEPNDYPWDDGSRPSCAIAQRNCGWDRQPISVPIDLSACFKQEICRIEPCREEDQYIELRGSERALHPAEGNDDERHISTGLPVCRLVSRRLSQDECAQIPQCSFLWIATPCTENAEEKRIETRAVEVTENPEGFALCSVGMLVTYPYETNGVLQGFFKEGALRELFQDRCERQVLEANSTRDIWPWVRSD